jgi:hypothetical protein
VELGLQLIVIVLVAMDMPWYLKVPLLVVLAFGAVVRTAVAVFAFRDWRQGRVFALPNKP